MKKYCAAIIVGAALFTAVGQAQAAVTTYNYTGDPYTDYADVSPGSGLANFGTNMTGSVTFNVDTSSLSGGPDLTTAGGDVLSLTMTSGLFTFDQTALTGGFSFTNGNITQWQIFFTNFASHNGLFAFGSSTAGGFGDAVSDLGLSGLGAATSEHCGPNGTNIPACAGTWTLVASGVPEPSTWAMMLIGFAGIGFMAYRRSRKTFAVV